MEPTDRWKKYSGRVERAIEGLNSVWTDDSPGKTIAVGIYVVDVESHDASMEGFVAFKALQKLRYCAKDLST